MSKEAYNKIIAKLENLAEYLTYLKEIQKVNKYKFTKDFHFFGLAERYLQLSIEVILDIGKLLIIANNLPRAADNSEIFEILAQKKILPQKIVSKFIGIANFRNILVHDYEKIDREIVYQKLQNNLSDFMEFKKCIKSVLRKIYK